MTRAEFFTLLKAHDWTFERSDDPMMFERGSKQEKVIERAKFDNWHHGDRTYDKMYRDYMAWAWDTVGDVVQPKLENYEVEV